MLYPPSDPPSIAPRVVITGAGIVTALGKGWDINAEGFRLGRTAFRTVTRFDVSRQRVKRAAEADLPEPLPIGKLSERHLARLDHSTQLLLAAASECWQQSGWEPTEALPVVLGTTAGGMALGEDFFRQAFEHPRARRRQATRAMYYQPHFQARVLTQALGCGGPITIVANACATGTNAIGAAWDLIRSGRHQRVLAGGYEGLAQMLFAGFDALQALSPTVCRPFDARRDGLALGEGAAVLALENLVSARARDADILGEVIGFGTTIDVHHLTQPHPEGDAALESMRRACASAGITAAEVDYLNAHGTGTLLNDSSEALAIQRWAGQRASTLPVSSSKAGIGHLLGAAGAVEAVVCLMALRGGFLPPETAFERPDPACCFPVVHEPEDRRLEIALSNSFGFGGVNATLILRRWP